MRIDVITLFPELVSGIQDYGVVGRALQAKHVELGVTNPRDFSQDANFRVDDRPYGGGPGMVMQYQPLARALDQVASYSDAETKVVYLSPQGQTLNQDTVKRFCQLEHLVFLAMKYSSRMSEQDVTKRNYRS